MNNRYPGTCLCGVRVAAEGGQAYRDHRSRWAVRCARCAATLAGIDYDPRGSAYGAHRVRYAGRAFETLFVSHGAHTLGDRVVTPYGAGVLVAIGYRTLTVLLDSSLPVAVSPGELNAEAA